jgi:putative MATE family efflux protein
MKDLTQGSIAGHLIALAVPTAAGMLFQTLYFFVDLYFVAELGDAAVAGVSAAGNVMFIVMALTQVLGVGTVALISHAVGRKDQQDANLVFNQSLLIAALSGLLALIAGSLMVGPYLRSVAADEATIVHGRTYLFWFLPGMALQFAMVSMASALRGTGIVKPVLAVQAATVLTNTALAPVLIAGWGTGRPLGVAGAGLASTIAVVMGVALLSIYFIRLEKYVSFHPEQWQPRLSVWKRLFTIGLPAGGEFALLFVYTGLTYWAIRDFGADAQAGFGIGSRIMQGIFLPAMAIAFVVAPVAGQNFGARRVERVRETFRVAATQCVCIMLVLMVLCQWQPEVLVAFFTQDAEVVRVGALFLHLISWNFVMTGLIFTCSGVFQALGNTVPALLSTASRITVYAVSLVWLTAQPDYKIEHVWYLSIGACVVQVVVSMALLRKQMRLRLGVPASQPA